MLGSGMRLLLVALAAAAVASSAAAAALKPLPADEKAAAVAALVARGDALNRLHHLGRYARPSGQELRALRLRGDALNAAYALGAYSRTQASFDWGDAGIGGATTLGILLIGLAGATTVRRRRQRPVQAA
jgi:hypothetical protein